MDTAADLADVFDRREWLRWSMCFLTVIALHAGGGLAWFFERDRGEVADFAPAVVMDFAVQPVMDAPVREIAPGQEQVQTEAAPPPSEAKPEPVREVEAEKPIPVKVAEARVEQVDRGQARGGGSGASARASIDSRRRGHARKRGSPPPAKVVEVKTEGVEKKSELQPTPPLATASETTAPTAASVRTASLVSWKIRISTHLQRYKRYPPAASERGEQGDGRTTLHGRPQRPRDVRQDPARLRPCPARRRDHGADPARAAAAAPARRRRRATSSRFTRLAVRFSRNDRCPCPQIVRFVE